MNFNIRPITRNDNQTVKQIVLSVLTEFGCVGPGFASSDAELDHMFESYQQVGSGYYVVENITTKEILGGGGFAMLAGTQPEERICELRKLYFLPALRGTGLGKKILNKIFSDAVSLGYKEMYLESTPQLSAALSLYEKSGFKKLSCHKGNTGHQKSCSIYMSKIFI
jgi:putative acetyltransferase